MARHCLWLLVVALWALSCAHHVSAQEVTVTITNPLIGNEGGSVVINCSVFTERNGGIVFSDPNGILLTRNGVVFVDNIRLTPIIRTDIKSYTLSDLGAADDGARIACSLSEYVSMEVMLQVNYPPSITGFSGELVTDGTVTMIAGESTTILFSINSRLAAVNTIQPFPGSTVRVPPSLTVAGNTIVIDSVDPTDQGVYLLVSTNSAGSSQRQFAIEVEYAPIFADAVSMEFSCDSSTEPLSCASRVGETGSFLCNFRSNPVGTLSASFSVADNSSVQLVDDSTITISATSPGNSGNYSCRASNVIRGQDRVTRREIVFLVGDVPMAVTEGTATVDDEFVTVSWMHSQQQEAIPVSSFTVVGGRINPPTSTINLRVVSGVFQVTLDRDTLDPGADYRVTVRAVNLLGGSDERDVTFRIPRVRSTPSTDSNSKGHNVESLSSLFSITLLLLSTLFC